MGESVKYWTVVFAGVNIVLWSAVAYLVIGDIRRAWRRMV